jgi:hypothetical protein
MDCRSKARHGDFAIVLNSLFGAHGAFKPFNECKLSHK